MRHWKSKISRIFCYEWIDLTKLHEYRRLEACEEKLYARTRPRNTPKKPRHAEDRFNLIITIRLMLKTP
jgi:hypothetical protein